MENNREKFLKQQLTKFLKKHSAEVSLSAIDEIVLSYMVSILEELDSASATDDDFDVDQFTEMMEAYLPGFAQINSVNVSEWMFELAGTLDNFDANESDEYPKDLAASHEQHSFESTHTDQPNTGNIKKVNPFSDIFSQPLSLPNGDCVLATPDVRTRTQSLGCSSVMKEKCERSRTQSSPCAEAWVNQRRRTQSSSSNASSDLSAMNGDCFIGNDLSDGEEDHDGSIRMLREMFPNACSMEINHCLSLANGDTEQTAQFILTREECGQSIKETPNQKKARQPGSKNRNYTSILDDSKMKHHIINKYSYVDVGSDKKDHKPVTVVKQDKKMIRYLDGKIVSTRGEKFTEIKKEDDEKMKKTFVNLKPAKQYRFH